MKRRFKLTDSTIAKLATPASGQRDYWDTEVPASGVRLTYNGTRTYQVATRVYDPECERWTPTRIAINRAGIISASEARKKAVDLLAQARDAVDVRRSAVRAAREAEARAAYLARRREKASAFGTVKEQFLEHVKKTKRPNTAKSYSGSLGHTTTLDALPLASITKADTSKILERLISEDKGVTANRVHAAIQALWNYARDRDLVQGEAPLRSERPSAEKARERVLTAAEIGTLWRTAEQLSAIQCAYVRIAILTGARVTELATLEHADVDLDQGVITVPTERMKAGADHVWPIPPVAVEILKAMAKRAGCKYVFFSTTGGPLNVSTFQGQLRKLCSFKEHWTLHDLRRTIATKGVELGVEPKVLDQILAHRQPSLSQVQAIYNRYNYMREARDALQKWADYVLKLAGVEACTAI